MHGGESIQSALCPQMSRYCVLYNETRPHNIMKQRSDLLLDAINYTDNCPCKDEILMEWLPFWISCVGGIKKNSIAVSDQQRTGRHVASLHRIHRIQKKRKWKLLHLYCSQHNTSRQESMTWNKIFQQPLYTQRRFFFFLYLQGKSATGQDII